MRIDGGGRDVVVSTLHDMQGSGDLAAEIAATLLESTHESREASHVAMAAAEQRQHVAEREKLETMARAATVTAIGGVTSGAATAASGALAAGFAKDDVVRGAAKGLEGAAQANKAVFDFAAARENVDGERAAFEIDAAKNAYTRADGDRRDAGELANRTISAYRELLATRAETAKVVLRG